MTQVTPNQIHVHDNELTIACTSPRAATELAERLLHAKPLGYITIDGLRRLAADDTRVAQITGRALATEASVGLFPGPQAGARKQAIEQCIALCEEAAAERQRICDSMCEEDMERVAPDAARLQARQLAEALRAMLNL